jgi:hypothetical protein
MQFFSIKRLAITVGMAAALAVGTGIIPNATHQTATAQASELSQHGGGHGGHGGGHGGGHMGNRHGGGHHGGGHGSFQGRNYRSSHGFSYWGYGFHNYYPQYYVTYAYEPVSLCETYYFDAGAWYCFAGY